MTGAPTLAESTNRAQIDDEIVSADGGALTTNCGAFAIEELVTAAIATTALRPLRRSGTTFGSQAVFEMF